MAGPRVMVEGGKGQVTAALPFDLEAERATLGSILIRERLSDVLGLVQSDDFLFPAHRVTFEAICELSASHRPLDVVTVSAELRRRGDLDKLEGAELYLMGLAGCVPTAESGRHYAQIVRERATARRLIMACGESSVRAVTEAPDEVIADLRVALASLRSDQGGPVAMAEAFPPYLDELEERRKLKEVRRVATGINALDKLLLGGGAVGQEIVIGGNTGSGKTSLALQWAVRAGMAGVPTLYFSLEMKRHELLDRALSFVSGVDGSRISSGTLDFEMWRTVKGREKALAAMELAIDDRKLTVDQITSEALRWRDKHSAKLALIVVDYLGIIKPSGKRIENRQQEVGGWSRDMKILAGDANAALVLCAQLNRQNVTGGDPRPPVLSDLRDSGEIEQNADVVLFPHRSGSLASIGVAKQRGGPVGAASVLWDGPTTSFQDDQGGDFRDAGEERYL